MPWWIWLILALFMLVMIVAGLAFVVWRGICAAKDVQHIGDRIGKRLAELGAVQQMEQPSEPPLFTQPLQVAQERYADAHAEVYRAKAATRNRHAQAWAKWKRFND
ncbi:hypothetical protein [Bifidobacterium oedipodis]|uniref:Uncharacterized protein n=1 Tax=Bifidobacterium oedipodis TaxID=2675322 RepID=A0A7Y0EN68_9BIFI|nr:hypothetical protein [Bifidobacterium sp. DSM 109957]NMM93262.1 hypothetical protein [Bifidobacterium sp. DSM 109957]